MNLTHESCSTTASRVCSTLALPAHRSARRLVGVQQKRGSVPCKPLSTQASAALIEQPQSSGSQQTVTPREGALFNWEKQWYPLAAIKDLDPSRSHSSMLLGKKLVLWQDATECWRCFEDVCPHRKVPLSEGRIETMGPLKGHLQCGYHGWVLNGEGRTTYIPQLASTDRKAEAAACANTRACAKSYPTQILQGLLFVWGSCDSSAPAESAATAAPINEFPDELGDSFSYNYENYTRDNPGGFEVWVDNSMDQSHGIFAHHSVSATRGGEIEGFFKMHPINIDPSASMQEPFSFSYDFSFNGKDVSTGHTRFTPPCLFTFKITELKGFSLWIYCVPVAPTCTRLIINSGGLAVPQSRIKKFLQRIPFGQGFIQDLFRALPHIRLNHVNDGDAVFLHQQSVNVLERKCGWKNAYYLPAESDRGVTVWLRWLTKKAGGGPSFAAGAPAVSMWDGPRLKREELLDRYTQHTRNCKACQTVLAAAQKGQVATLAALGVLFLTAAGLLGRGLAPGSAPVLATAALAVAAAWLNRWLHGFASKFMYTNWHQADLPEVPESSGGQ